MTDTLVPHDDSAAAADGPDAATVRRARLFNLPGIVVPFLANFGMRLTAPPELRWFGVGAGVVLSGAALWAWSRGNLWIAATCAAAHAGLVLTGLVHPRLPELPGRAWIAFGKGLGRWMAYPIFALLYFVAVTPTALLVRLFGKDPLARRAPPASSYWVQRKPAPKERFERQF